MRFGVAVVLLACVLVAAAGRGSGSGERGNGNRQREMIKAARRLQARTAVMKEALEICLSQFASSSTVAPQASEENDDDDISLPITRGDIISMRRNLRQVAQELEDCTQRLEDTMGGGSTDEPNASAGSMESREV